MDTHQMVQALHRTLIGSGCIDIPQAAHVMGVPVARVLSVLYQLQDVFGSSLSICDDVAQWRHRV